MCVQKLIWLCYQSIVLEGMETCCVLDFGRHVKLIKLNSLHMRHRDKKKNTEDKGSFIWGRIYSNVGAGWRHFSSEAQSWHFQRVLQAPASDRTGRKGLFGLAGWILLSSAAQTVCVTCRQVPSRAGSTPEALECLSTQQVESLQTLGGAAVSHKTDRGPPGRGEKAEKNIMNSRSKSQDSFHRRQSFSLLK